MKIIIDGKEIKYYNTELTLNVSLDNTEKIGLTSLQIFKEDKEFVDNLIRSDFLKHFDLEILSNNIQIIKGYVSYLNNGNRFNCDYIDLEIYLKNSLEYLEQFYERKLTEILDDSDFYFVPHKLSNVPDDGRLIVYLILVYLLLGSIKYYTQQIIAIINSVSTNPLNAGQVITIIYYVSMAIIDLIAILQYLDEIWKVTFGQLFYAKCIDVRLSIKRIFNKIGFSFNDNFAPLKDLFLIIPKDAFGYFVNIPTLKDLIFFVETFTNTKLIIKRDINGYTAEFIGLNNLYPINTQNIITKFNYENKKPSRFNYHIKQIKYKYDESDLNSLNNDIATDFTVSFVDKTINTLYQKEVQKVLLKEMPFNVAKRKGKLSNFEILLLKLFQSVNAIIIGFENVVNGAVSGLNSIINTFNKLINFLNKLLKLNLKPVKTMDKITLKKIDLKELKEIPSFFLTESTAFSVPKLFYGRYAYQKDNRDVYVLQEGSEKLLDLKVIFDYYHKNQTIYEEYDFKTIFCIENGLPDAIQFNGNYNMILEYEWKSKNKLLSGVAINPIGYTTYKNVSFNK